MAEFNVRADEVNVEQIMHQIRARIRERRGVDYTEEQIQELAKIKLEKFLDPKGLRSDLLERFQQSDLPTTYEFDDTTLIRSANPFVGFMRRLLQPVLKLFFSPNVLVHALHVQTEINRYLLERNAIAYEVMHNLVVEMTRTGIEVKNMKMRVESIAGRLDFNERRARALEAVVQYKPEGQGGRAIGAEGAPRGDRGRGQGGRAFAAEGQGGRGFAAEGQGGRGFAAAEGQGGAPSPQGDQGGVDPLTGGESLRSRRRRRRRGRRSGPGFGGEERRGASDEGRATNDEPAQPSSNDELRATTNDELERRSPSGEPERAASGESERRVTSDAPERVEPTPPDAQRAHETGSDPDQS